MKPHAYVGECDHGNPARCPLTSAMLLDPCHARDGDVVCAAAKAAKKHDVVLTAEAALEAVRQTALVWIPPHLHRYLEARLNDYRDALRREEAK